MKLLPVLVLAVCARIAAADNDVSITLNGSVVQLPCDVDTTHLNMDLGAIYASDLAEGGKWVHGAIKLSNCPDSTNSITATFSGHKGKYFYKNSGQAENVEIQLQSDQKDLNNNESIALSITDARTATLPVQVRAFSTGNVTSGTIEGIINVTYTYQ